MAEAGGHWVKKAGGTGPGGTVFVSAPQLVQENSKQKASFVEISGTQAQKEYAGRIRDQVVAEIRRDFSELKQKLSSTGQQMNNNERNFYREIAESVSKIKSASWWIEQGKSFTSRGSIDALKQHLSDMRKGKFTIYRTKYADVMEVLNHG